MTAMSPALDQALAGPNPTIFGAIEIVLPAHTIRLIAGSRTIIIDAKTFTGRDGTYGVVYSIEDLTDGTGDQAPAIRLTLIPESEAAASDLSSAAMQGSQVTLWLGAVDPATGLVIGEPLVVFLGQLDVPTLKSGSNSYLLELEITSVFEEFFFNDDGARLSDTFQQYVWPGETGLANCTNVLHQIYWGANPPAGVSL